MERAKRSRLRHTSGPSFRGHGGAALGEYPLYDPPHKVEELVARAGEGREKFRLFHRRAAAVAENAAIAAVNGIGNLPRLARHPVAGKGTTMPSVSAWFDGWGLRRELRDYPIYTPPFPGDYDELTSENAKANFQYFKGQKEKRLEYLATLLSRYDISFGFEVHNLEAVGAWVYRYGGHLLRDKGNLDALECFEPTWSRRYAGLNVVHDLNVYMGEYIIRHNHYVFWTLSKLNPEELGYFHPCLGGIHNVSLNDPLYILETIFRCCEVQRSRIHGRCLGCEQWINQRELSDFVKYLADPDREPVWK